MAGDAVTLSVPGPHGDREVRISSPTRVIWPEPGITKLELAEYLVTVGDAFIEANGDRPVSLQRFPGGIDGEQFFSKNPPKGAPEWVRSVTVTYPSGRRHPQLVLDEPAAAVWAAQMNTIVFHPWASSAGNTDNPDQLRIDLDPQPGTGFAEAVPAALALRELMGEAGLTAFVKTSGNRGIHVFAPIEPEHEFLDVRHAVIALARELERRMPDELTTAWWKEERGDRIFIDYNQANRDRTMAGAYSPQAAAARLGVVSARVGRARGRRPGRVHDPHGARSPARARRPLGGHAVPAGPHRHAPRLVAARPRRRPRRAAVPARLPEDARGADARAAQPRPQPRVSGCRDARPGTAPPVSARSVATRLLVRATRRPSRSPASPGRA